MFWLEQSLSSFAFEAALRLRQRGNGKAFRGGSEAPWYVGRFQWGERMLLKLVHTVPYIIMLGLTRSLLTFSQRETPVEHLIASPLALTVAAALCCRDSTKDR